jgi:hypothetical protein
MLVRRTYAIVALPLVVGCGDGADTPPSQTSDVTESPNAGNYSFSVAVRLFGVGSIPSQRGTLSGTFSMDRPAPPHMEAKVNGFTFRVSLDADVAVSGYTLESTPPKEGRSYGRWLTSQNSAEFFLERDTPLTSGAENSVFQEPAGTGVRIRLYPYCTIEPPDCELGLLSAFDLKEGYPNPYRMMALQAEESFTLRPEAP